MGFLEQQYLRTKQTMEPPGDDSNKMYSTTSWTRVLQRPRDQLGTATQRPLGGPSGPSVAHPHFGGSPHGSPVTALWRRAPAAPPLESLEDRILVPFPKFSSIPNEPAKSKLDFPKFQRKLPTSNK